MKAAPCRIRPRYPIYLASRSPRRRELLQQVHIPFAVLDFRGPPREDALLDERSLPYENAAAYAERVARNKALHGWQIAHWRGEAPRPVLAADTTLEFAGEIIGKPRDAADAAFILQRLSGQMHRVITAVALTYEAQQQSALSVSEVRFGVLDKATIDAYVASGEPLDKAGAYAIQGQAARFVTHLAGSYSGVMGLPLYETCALLEALVW